MEIGENNKKKSFYFGRPYAGLLLIKDEDELHQRVSSIMIFNPATKKYEIPPPRWFNKATGEYEDIKPMYFVDPANPALGFVTSDAVIREDHQFRQFLEDKEARRCARLERERFEAQQAKEASVTPRLLPTPSTHHKKEKMHLGSLDFDEELAQKAFRETTGKMISKRGATAISGPGLQHDLQRKRELEQKYNALKPFVPEDEQLEGLTPVVNSQEIIQAWQNPVAVAPPPKKKIVKTEKERARELVKRKSGLGIRTGSMWTFAAMKGSYCPPGATDLKAKTGWAGEDKNLAGVKEESGYGEKWRGGELLNRPWWEAKPVKWKSRDELREEYGGRLAINPATGKLEDVAPARQETGYKEATGPREREGEISLLM